MLPVLSRSIAATGVALALWAPASFAASDCGLKQVTSIPASLSAAGELLLDATLNGYPVKLMASTNAEVSTLAEKFVQRAGMPIADLHNHAIYSSGQRTLNERTRISELVLGQAKTSSEGFVISPDGGDGTDGTAVGTLAADYLSNYDIELDLADGKVNLFDHDHCKGQVVYWAKEYLASPIYMSNTGIAHRPQIDIIADGKTLRGMIATGYASTTLRLAVAQDRFDLAPNSADLPKAGTWKDSDGKESDRYSHSFKSFGFGDITLHNSTVVVDPINVAAHLESTGSRLSNANGQQPDLYIGMSLLKQLRLYIAYSEDMIYYTVATPKQAAGQ